MENNNPKIYSSINGTFSAQPTTSQSTSLKTLGIIDAHKGKLKNLSRKKIYILITFVIVLTIFIVAFMIVPFLKPSLTATIKINNNTIEPVGTLNYDVDIEDVRDEVEKKKTTITITYKNNTSQTLKNVKVRLREIKSAGEKNIMLIEGINITSYQEESPEAMIFTVNDLPPHTTNYIQFYIVGQHKGSALMTADVISGDLKAKTDTLPIKIQ